MTIDMIESVRALEKVGFKREQAEAQVVTMNQHTKDLATKAEMSAEFEKVRSEMHFGFKEIRSEMRSGFKEIRAEMDAGFKEMRYEMKSFLTTKKFLWITTAVFTLFATFLTIVLSLLEFRHELLNLLR